MIALLACVATPTETGFLESAPHSDPLPESPPDEPERPWDDAPCDGLDATSGYTDVFATWAAQDALVTPPGGLVVVGSSSIRRWEHASWDLREWGPIQRGFGGAELREVAGNAAELVLAHDAPVLVFAGTNDLANGRSVDDTLTAWRCLAEQVESPLITLGITPTPARWADHARATEWNEAVQALTEQHPRWFYVDIPGAFLATGEPPAAELFVEDQLHLSEAGYALWTETVRPVVAQAVEARSPAATGFSAGTLRIDLGPSNDDDGERTEQVGWNDWHAVEGGEPILPGEHLALVDTDGQPSGVQLVIAGGFRSNGKQNGGLYLPDESILGDLAVRSATIDYVYVDGTDDPGALMLTGLDPNASFTLTLFASREWGEETRVTRYTVRGDQEHSTTLTTSGPDIGQDGYDGNTNSLAVLTGLVPDAWGQLHVDVVTEQGAYAYLSLLEVRAE